MEAEARDFIDKLILPDLLGELCGDDRWNGLPAGELRLQIGVRNAFGALYEDQWEPQAPEHSVLQRLSTQHKGR